jgi:hypothetical protein
MIDWRFTPRRRASRSFDRAFDDGEDVTSQLDMSAARRPGLEQRRVNVDFPAWMIESLDLSAQGTPRGAASW